MGKRAQNRANYLHRQSEFHIKASFYFEVFSILDGIIAEMERDTQIKSLSVKIQCMDFSALCAQLALEVKEDLVLGREEGVAGQGSTCCVTQPVTAGEVSNCSMVKEKQMDEVQDKPRQRKKRLLEDMDNEPGKKQRRCRGKEVREEVQDEKGKPPVKLPSNWRELIGVESKNQGLTNIKHEQVKLPKDWREKMAQSNNTTTLTTH